MQNCSNFKSQLPEAQIKDSPASDSDPARVLAAEDPLYCRLLTARIQEEKNLVISGQIRQHVLRVDRPEASGGDDTAPTTPETFLFALGSCVVATGRFIASQQKIAVKAIGVEIKGELDLRRAFGLCTDGRAGFQRIKIRLNIDADLPEAKRRSLLEEIASRCPVCDSVANATSIEYDLQPEDGNSGDIIPN
jgi:uncharacterized OsmC-like protein